jgi:hypothetical protein
MNDLCKKILNTSGILFENEEQLNGMIINRDELLSTDKYQIINIVYLALCCVWHSVCASLNIDHESKFYLDKVVLCCFATVFTLIQLTFSFSFMKSYQKIKALKNLEDKFTKQLDHNQLDEDD